MIPEPPHKTSRRGPRVGSIRKTTPAASLAAFCCMSLWAGAPVSEHWAYRATGSLSYEVHQPQLRTGVLHSDFELRTTGKGWWMRVVQRDNASFESFVYQYDGSNLVHYFTLSGPQATLPSGTVEECPVPHTSSSDLHEFIWLALASGSYFKGLTNNLALSLKPLESPVGHFRRVEVPCKFTLAERPPYVPLQVEYFRTNLAYLLETDEVTNLPLPKLLEKGFVQGKFTCQAQTNVAGLSFPTEFDYRQFGPTPDGKGVSCRFTVKGSVQSVALGDQTWPGLPERLNLEDLRHPVPGVHYRLTNGVVPNLGAPVVVSAGNRALRLHERQPPPSPSRSASLKAATLCVMAFCSALPIALILSTRFRKISVLKRDDKLKNQSKHDIKD
jgi:hypothetical protein